MLLLPEQTSAYATLAPESGQSAFVTHLGHDRTSLARMGEQARDATGTDTLTVLADRGYFSGPEVLACEKARVVAICPKPLT